MGVGDAGWAFIFFKEVQTNILSGQAGDMLPLLQEQ